MIDKCINFKWYAIVLSSDDGTSVPKHVNFVKTLFLKAADGKLQYIWFTVTNLETFQQYAIWRHNSSFYSSFYRRKDFPPLSKLLVTLKKSEHFKFLILFLRMLCMTLALNKKPQIEGSFFEKGVVLFHIDAYSQNNFEKETDKYNGLRWNMSEFWP